MPREFEDDDDLDNVEDLDEEDRDARYYEYVGGGPEDEELESWLEEDEEESDYDSDWHDDPAGRPAGLGLPVPRLPVPQPGDEAAARDHFRALQRKYKAESFTDKSPLSRLYTILLKVEFNEWLDDGDLSWLRKNRLRGPIRAFATRVALECEARLMNTKDAWDGVGASKFWRMADQPAKAVAVTEELAQTPGLDPKLKAAILTTRGGAFRDQGNLESAGSCGHQAIQLGHQSFHPYMLLGAVYYQKGDPQKGELRPWNETTKRSSLW